MSGLQDGFGDGLTVTERIEQLDRLNRIRAAEHAHPQAESDDLTQEGRIVVWEVASKRPESTREYLSAAAAMRIREVANRQTWTGHTRAHGQPTDPLRNRAKESLDDPDYTLIEALQAPAWLAAAELAYHHGEILDAINALPPAHRDYVYLRFWGGYSNPEIAPLIQRDAGNLARMWTHSIAPALAAQLAHLAG